ncbi:MAG: CHASE domain-containing protein [Burkholderiales bacterium]
MTTVFVSLEVKKNLEADAAVRFALVSDQVAVKVGDRLDAYALILRGAAGLFAACDTVSRAEWRAYVDTLRAHQTVPGVQGIGFSQVIAPAQLPRHLAGVRAEGFPQYTVRPPGERALYTSIIYLEPFRDRNLRAFGFDMFSESVRRAAMEQARDGGEASLSGKVELVQETETEVQAGTLMYFPVYRNGATVQTAEQRRAALLGWTYSPYRMKDLMTGILADWSDAHGSTIDLHIYDGTEPAAGALLFDSQSVTPITDAPAARQQRRVIDFHGRQWLLTLEPTQSLSYTTAWATLAGGLVLSSLLFWLVRSRINTQVNAKRIAERLTQEVQQYADQLKVIFALSPDGMVTFDGSHRVRYVNPAFTQLTGLLPGTVLGQDDSEFSRRLNPLCLPRARLPALSALAGSGPVTRHVIELANADQTVLEVTLRESHAPGVSHILYLSDITHKTEVDRMKSEFLATAAHELRTPMASIYGFAEVLLTQELDAANSKEFLGIIFKQSEMMASILNELLDLARIEARRGADFVFEVTPVQVLVEKVVREFKLPEARVSPTLIGTDAHLSILADPLKVQQAVLNVLSNAYKYSPMGGEVQIELLESPDVAGAARLVGIRITDHGIGMTPEQQARVFERFYRADTSGKILGTGLGMSIVHEIVALHGGRVELDSKTRVGTTVTLWWPEGLSRPLLL